MIQVRDKMPYTKREVKVIDLMLDVLSTISVEMSSEEKTRFRAVYEHLVSRAYSTTEKELPRGMIV